MADLLLDTPIRFTGLVSGLDFDRIIDALLAIRRLPIDRLEREKQILLWRQELWTEVQDRLSDLREAIVGLLDPSKALPFVSSSTDPGIARAIALRDALPGVYEVTVHQLATPTRVTSDFSDPNALGLGGAIDPTLALQNTPLGIPVTGGTFTVNGVSIPVDPTVDSLNDVINRINDAVPDVTASYDATTDRLILTSPNPISLGAPTDTSNFLMATGLLNSPEDFDGTNYTRRSVFHLGRLQTTVPLARDNLRVSLSQMTGSFEVNGVVISYDATTDSLIDILDRINRTVPSLRAFYDPLTDRVVLVNKETGSGALLRSDINGNLLDALGLLDSGQNAQARVTPGQNASLTIRGFNDDQPITSASNTVTGVIPGVTLQLISADATKVVTITINRDKAALKEAIKVFVEKFNAAVSLIHRRLTEEPIDDPRTVEEQKVGLLRGDGTLFFIRSVLVREVTTPVFSLPSDSQMLAQIGITLNTDGTLTLNETKLQAALDANPNQVLKIFFDDADNDGVVDDGEDGVAVRLKQRLDEWLSMTLMPFGSEMVPEGTVTRQPTFLQLRIQALDRRIAELNERISLEAQILRLRFIALERRLASLQQRWSFPLFPGESLPLFPSLNERA